MFVSHWIHSVQRLPSIITSCIIHNPCVQSSRLSIVFSWQQLNPHLVHKKTTSCRTLTCWYKSITTIPHSIIPHKNRRMVKWKWLDAPIIKSCSWFPSIPYSFVYFCSWELWILVLLDLAIYSSLWYSKRNCFWCPWFIYWCCLCGQYCIIYLIYSWLEPTREC